MLSYRSETFWTAGSDTNEEEEEEAVGSNRTRRNGSSSQALAYLPLAPSASSSSLFLSPSLSLADSGVSVFLPREGEGERRYSNLGGSSLREARPSDARSIGARPMPANSDRCETTGPPFHWLTRPVRVDIRGGGMDRESRVEMVETLPPASPGDPAENRSHLANADGGCGCTAHERRTFRTCPAFSLPF